MYSNHGIDQILDRLEFGDRVMAQRKMRELYPILKNSNNSTACVVGRNTGNSRSGDGSNGRLIVAIWRGRWVTAMLRREGQGLDPSDLRVERVIA